MKRIVHGSSSPLRGSLALDLVPTPQPFRAAELAQTVRRPTASLTATLAALVLASAIGCSITNKTPLVIDNCAQDSTVSCMVGSFGFSCTGNATPGAMNTALLCKAGAEVGSKTTYCCDAPKSFSCSANANVAGCANGATGYSCYDGAMPEQFNTALVCGAGVAGQDTATDYCCAPGTTSCSADTTVTGCKNMGIGYSCTLTDTPEQHNPLLACGEGLLVNAVTIYCCYKLAPGKCVESASVPGCTSPSFGFSCTGSNTPTEANSSFVCGSGTAGNGTTLYCCTE